MKFSHAWLEEHVAIREDPARVGARLTAAGLPLDGLEGEGAAAVYDFDIFPNRPDCMSHVGLAREYAALTGASLRKPPTAPALRQAGPPASGPAAVAIEAPELCRRYSARSVLGVRIAPSPAWLRGRLESIGQRPINNVVDVTNFVLWELGHPLHAFDLDRIEKRRIIVRLAGDSETLVTLDGVERRLRPDMLVIADARRPVALAGVIGGRASEISETTRNVLLEGAWFDPASVRRTARALGLRTDASSRFERGADPEGSLPALDRAAALIVEVAGGALAAGPLDLYPLPFAARTVRLRPSRARALVGFELDEGSMREALERREFRIAGSGADLWEVSVPSFRRDVEREADLVEEVARHRGYDAIPSELPLLPGVIGGGGRGAEDRIARAARGALLAAGLSEAVNYDLIDREECLLFDPDLEAPLAVEKPLQSQASHLRSSLLPGLLRNVAHNLNRGVESSLLFEIGKAYGRRPGTPRLERLRAAFVLAGRGAPIPWSLPRREIDVYDARGAADLLAERLGISPLSVSSGRIPFLEAGRALLIGAAGGSLGVLGEISRAILARYGLERRVFCGEIELEGLSSETERRFRPLPRHPGVRRDLALVVGRGVTFEEIERVVRGAATLPVASVGVFDRYRGPGVPDDSVSLAIEIVFLHPDRTLAAEEVQAAQDSIVHALGRDLGARLRGPVTS